MWWPKPLRSGMLMTIVCYWDGLANNRLSSCLVLLFLYIRLVSFEYMFFTLFFLHLSYRVCVRLGRACIQLLWMTVQPPNERRFADRLLSSIQAFLFFFFPSVLRAAFFFWRGRGLTHSSRRLQESSHLSGQLNSSAQRWPLCCRITAVMALEFYGFFISCY